jgi:hypothetical protein
VAADLHRLKEDLERDEAQRERLKQLWEAAEPVADQFAVKYVAARFR